MKTLIEVSLNSFIVELQVTHLPEHKNVTCMKVQTPHLERLKVHLKTVYK